MATFVGVQPKGGTNPTLAHDHDPLDEFTAELVIVGEQPAGAVAPTVKSIPKRKDEDLGLFGVIASPTRVAKKTIS